MFRRVHIAAEGSHLPEGGGIQSRINQAQRDSRREILNNHVCVKRTGR